jgi:hypothetical protein
MPYQTKLTFTHMHLSTTLSYYAHDSGMRYSGFDTQALLINFLLGQGKSTSTALTSKKIMA